MIRMASLVLVLALRDGVAEQKTVRAEIVKDTAWTGEPVPLVITLYSPGPFSGTASFDLPELPRTAILRGGSPLVGSEQVDGESYFTQRHELTVYTQNAGEIVIPAFRVRFSGKTTFMSDPKPMEGFTPELRFRSKRPPETDKLGVVVAATEMEVTQTWRPASMGTVYAGDVIERTITRRATGTTAMMLPPVSADAPVGVRVYAAEPSVQDHTERGHSRAERIDTIKYQFEGPGTFELPDVRLVWWDPQVSELKANHCLVTWFTSRGLSQPQPQPQRKQRSSPSPLAMLFFLGVGTGLAISLGSKPVRRWVARWRARRNNPEVLAVRRLLSACRSSDAPAAYAAFVQWTRIVSASESGPDFDRLLGSAHTAGLRNEWAALSEHIFALETPRSQWSGQQLAETFARARRSVEADETCAL